MMAQEPSLEQAFHAHRNLLWDVSRRLTGSAADADDIVQETFRRAMETPPKSIDRPWLPWLMRVAVNIGRDHIRRRRRQTQSELFDEFPSTDEPVERSYETLERVTLAFRHALKTLALRERAVLVLRDVFDYSVRETAAMLGMSEANVKQVHCRARKGIRRHDVRRYDRDARRSVGSLVVALRQGDHLALLREAA
jgi:RNA polymerase sigma-70 factor (ECF subfamily)